MPSLPNIVRPCLNEAVARSARLVERCVEHAENALEEDLRRRANAADRQDITAAARVLAGLRVSWTVRFPQALRAALEAPVVKPAASSGALRPSSLTLVDDNELMRSIEAARLAQELGPLLEQPLAELDALMSPALGLDGIQPDRNPLRPEVFTQTLREVMGESDPQPGWPALWMRYMMQPLSQDLAQIYRAASKLLKQAGVESAKYRLVTSAAPLTPTGGRGGGKQGRNSGGGDFGAPSQFGSSQFGASQFGASQFGNSQFGASQFGASGSGASGFGNSVPPGGGRPGGSRLGSLWSRARQALHGPLLRDFLFGGRNGGGHVPLQQKLEPAYYAQVNEELAHLESPQNTTAAYDAHAAQAYAHLPPVERPMRAVGADSPLNHEVWGAYGEARQRSLVRARLKQQAERVGQAVGLDVVHQLVDQVAQDPRLLAPVREAIVALEPSLARLAMQSPQFFGQEDHPARQLVERVAERSFKYNDEFSSQFEEFFQTISSAFNALNRLEQLQDARPFETVLHRLEAGWQAQDDQEERQRQQVLDAVQFAERRQAEAEQIAWELSQRPDMEGAPALVQDFLFGTWSLVMAHARLTSDTGRLDPGNFGAMISDLLWSVKPELALRDPAHAFELIPRVVIKLREGLELLGQPLQQYEVFFRALERLHRPVLKLRAKHRRQTLETLSGDLPIDDELLPAAAQTPHPAEELWLAPGELQACGFEDTMPSGHVELSEPQDDSGEAFEAAALPVSDAEAEAVIAGLGEGSWVDLYSRQQWRRARLVWAGTRGSLFMFVSQGNRPHSMTRRSLHRLVVGRLLRPIKDHEVVQHAIDALAADSEPSSQPQALAA